MKKLNVVRALVGAVAVLCLSTAGVLAQSSAITGTVVDSSGAVIPGAEVTVTNVGTGDQRTVLSNDDGGFRVSPLSSGQYQVKASLTGFKTSISEAFGLTVGQTAHIQLAMEVGSISEEITVTDVAATIELEQGRVSSLVDQKRVVNLPLNGRNVMELVRLTPGSINAASTVNEPGAGNSTTSGALDGANGNTSVNGGRINMNGFWLDGVSSKNLSGGVASTPAVDSVQEFRVETLNFSAEYGASVGSVVSIVTKSGTNEFHGSVYEFHRNDNADAREFFDADKPEFKQNQFGLTFGGPIIKDKTFFFFSYEGTRIRTGNSAITQFESPAWSNFVLNAPNAGPVAKFLYSNFGVDRPVTSAMGTDQTAGELFGIATEDEENQPLSDAQRQALLDTALGAQFGSAAGALGINEFVTGTTSIFTPVATDGDQFSLRVDQDLTDQDKVYARYFFDDVDSEVIDPRPAFNSPQKVRTHHAVVAWTRVLSPSVVNEARVGFNRMINDIDAGTPGVPLITESTGVATFGAYNGYPQEFHENTFTWSDTLSINVGRHGLKMGFEVRRNQENSQFNVGRPSYVFFGLDELALDDPFLQVGGVNPGSGPGDAQLASNFRAWRGTEIGLFFNDDFKLRPNLTLNLGVRWDWFGRLIEDQNRTTKFDLDNAGTNIFERVALGGFSPADQLSSDDYNNIAPRIGLAWDPFGDGKMSIRAGYGVAFNGAVYNPLANSRWNPPFYSFNLIDDSSGRPNETVLFGPQDGTAVRADGANPNIGASLFEGNIIAYDPFNNNTNFLSGIPNPNMRDPYVQSFFLGIQREVFRDWTFEANYVGTLGRKLIRAEDFNRFNGDFLGLPSPADGSFDGDTSLNRVNSGLGVLRFWENSVNSNYHSLQLQLDKRFSRGIAFNVNYTLSKSLDTRSTWHSGATTSNRGQEGFSTDVERVFLDYGRSIFDARHRFVTNWIWETPWFRDSRGLAQTVLGGWQINGVVSWQDSQPFTPHTANGFTNPDDPGDFNADGTNNDRPNVGTAGTNVDFDNVDFANGAFGPFADPNAPNPIAARGFGMPADGTTGNLGRNTFDGPTFANVDFSLFKQFNMGRWLTEVSKLEFRVEFFNFFNKANFLQPEARLNSGLFGFSTDTFDAREIQWGLKLIF